MISEILSHFGVCCLCLRLAAPDGRGLKLPGHPCEQSGQTQPFDDVEEERHTHTHATSVFYIMATVQVSEAEKVYILHGIRVSF